MKLSRSVIALLLAATGVASFAPSTSFMGTKLRHLRMAQTVDKEWVAEDMEKAGHAEEEGKDWVAEKMNKLDTAADRSEDWIAQDMKKAGEAGAHTAKLKDKKKESDRERIAKDMIKTGKGSEDWIARDMSEAGDPEAHSRDKSTPWWSNKLFTSLKEERDRDYKDIKDDMEETGKIGSEKTDLITQEMEKTGHAETPLDKLAHWANDFTYKLGEWETKAFGLKKLTEEMEEAGRAKNTTWAIHDMETAGHAGTATARKTPEQKQDLKDEVAHVEVDKWVAKDMKKEGQATSGWAPRQEGMSKKKMETMIADDMKMAGKVESDDWVRQDMEEAGHAVSFDSPYGQGSSTKTQYKRETEEFMKTRKVKMAPEPEPEPKKKSRVRRFFRALLKYSKKVIMPWRKLENL